MPSWPPSYEGRWRVLEGKRSRVTLLGQGIAQGNEERAVIWQTGARFGSDFRNGVSRAVMRADDNGVVVAFNLVARAKDACSGNKGSDGSGAALASV